MARYDSSQRAFRPSSNYGTANDTARTSTLVQIRGLRSLLDSLSDRRGVDEKETLDLITNGKQKLDAAKLLDKQDSDFMDKMPKVPGQETGTAGREDPDVRVPMNGLALAVVVAAGLMAAPAMSAQAPKPSSPPAASDAGGDISAMDLTTALPAIRTLLNDPAAHIDPEMRSILREISPARRGRPQRNAHARAGQQRPARGAARANGRTREDRYDHHARAAGQREEGRGEAA